METLFNDNHRSNTETREHNINVLKENGFTEGGLYCTSGNMYLTKKKTKTQLVFGMRYNVGGGFPKYFSLSKDYSSKKEAITDFNKIKTSLKK